MSLNMSKKLLFLALITLMTASSVFADEEVAGRSVKPLNGELLLPDDYNEAENKKCLTICDQWGKDCIINPSTGSRKCRRVCKSFTEECF